jgi:hypothetical protein
MPETATTECIMTLPETAAFLRVSEDVLAEQAEAGEVPGRKIGGEWRFLQRALVDWFYGRELANGAVCPVEFGTPLAPCLNILPLFARGTECHGSKRDRGQYRPQEENT